MFFKHDLVKRGSRKHLHSHENATTLKLESTRGGFTELRIHDYKSTKRSTTCRNLRKQNVTKT